MELKICGMKYPKNMLQVATLKPDYLGFIFYEKSPRNFEGIIPELPKSIKKVGVFVNEYIEIVVSLTMEYQLDSIQLHGNENNDYIKKLKQHLPNIKIIKAFSIAEEFDFSLLTPYLNTADYFLFDTKGAKAGGNGVAFNWAVLEEYHYTKPYFLSGGIGLENVEALQVFIKSNAAKYCIAVDVNSKFETQAGEKSVKKLKQFITVGKLKRRNTEVGR